MLIILFAQHNMLDHNKMLLTKWTTRRVVWKTVINFHCLLKRNGILFYCKYTYLICLLLLYHALSKPSLCLSFCCDQACYVERTKLLAYLSEISIFQIFWLIHANCATRPRSDRGAQSTGEGVYLAWLNPRSKSVTDLHSSDIVYKKYIISKILNLLVHI
jgi:hypothetical protein